MGRCLVTVDLRTKDCKTNETDQTYNVVIGCVHLESMSTASERQNQLKITVDKLQANEKAIICGDFNFDSSQNYGEWQDKTSQSSLENDVLEKVCVDYIDVWPHLMGDEKGFTYDGLTNPECCFDQLLKAKQHERMRYDRVLIKGLIPKHTELLGTNKFRVDNFNEELKDKNKEGKSKCSCFAFKLSSSSERCTACNSAHKGNKTCPAKGIS